LAIQEELIILELIGIIILCYKNAENAEARGRSKLIAVTYTAGIYVIIIIFFALLPVIPNIDIFDILSVIILLVIWGRVSYKISTFGEIIVKPDDEMNSSKRALLNNAAISIFNYNVSDISSIKEIHDVTIKKNIDILRVGGVDSIKVIRELLMQCAEGKGASISPDWWIGSIWIIRIIVLLQKRKTLTLLIKILEKYSLCTEWYTYTQEEAAKQLGKIGTKNEIPILKEIVEEPFIKSPIDEIKRAIDKINK
jgi:hypothetical protein